MGWFGCSLILEHFVVFQLVLTHPGLKSGIVFLLDSLLYEEFYDKVSKFYQLFELVENWFN